MPGQFSVEINTSGPEGGPIALSGARERLQEFLDRIAERIRASEVADASTALNQADAGGADPTPGAHHVELDEWRA